MSKLRYKYCVVPECKNTTFKTPGKLFFSLPANTINREKWCKAMGRVGDKYKPLTSNRFCCEDHFDLPNDMENYLQHKMVGVKKFKLKKGVIPHRFDCKLDDTIDSKCDESQSRKYEKINYNNIQVEKIDKATPQPPLIRVDGSTQTENSHILPTETYIVKLEYESDSSEYQDTFEVQC